MSDTSHALQGSESAAVSPAARPRLSKTVISLGFVSMLTDMSSEMAYSQVPLYLTRVLGAQPEAVGLIEGVAESTASLVRIAAGWVSDRVGRRKPLIAIGYTLGAVSKPLIALATTWPLVLLLRFLDRLGKGIRTAPRDALIAESTPPAIRGRAFGLHRAMDTTGAVLGPLIGWLLLRFVGGDFAHRVRVLLVFAGLPGLLAILTLWLIVRERGSGAPAAGQPDAISRSGAAPVANASMKANQGAGDQPPRVGFVHAIRSLDPTYRRFLAAILIFNLGNSSDAFLVLRATDVGVRADSILLLYGVFNMVEAALGYFAGQLSDRVGRRPLVIAGCLVFALVYAGFALVHTVAGVWVLFLLYGGYYTLTQGTQRAWSADLSHPERRATQIGAYHTVVGCALLPASVVAGRLYQWNPALPFAFGALTALVAAATLALMVPSSRPDH